MRVWINQYPWLAGRMAYTVDGENIVASIYANLSLYVNQLKTLQLNNLSDPLINDQKHFDTYADFCAYLKATTTAAPGAEIMVFFPFRNTGAYKTIDPDSYGDYPDINLPVNEVFNAWQTDEENNGSFLVDENFPIRQTQVPFFYLPYILKRIVRLLGFRPVGKWLDEEAPNRIVVASLIPVASWNIIADYWLYMPAVPVADFLKAVRTEFGLVIAFNEVDKICIIESLSNLVKTGDIVDLRPYQIAGSMRETGSSSQAYTITQTPDDKDAIFSDDEKQNLPVLTIGTPVMAIQTTDVAMISATTKMITESSPAFPSPSNWRIPAISQPVAGSAPLDQISSVENADAHNFRIRFLYYHGLVPDDSNLFSYPYGSSDNKDKNGNVIADTSLSLSAAGSAYLAIRNLYRYMANSKPFEMVFSLPPKKLLDIRADSRILISDFNFAPVYCLWAQLGVDLGDDQALQPRLTLWPQILTDNATEILPDEDAGPPVEPPDNGDVWVRLELRNIVDFEEEHPTPSFGQRGDLYVTFWADAEATVPKDVTDLPLRYSETIATDGTPAAPVAISYPSTETGGELLIAADRPISVTSGTDPDVHHYDYSYAALVSAYYQVLETITIS
ncbi:MAG TPA: hypothetical protein VHA56_16075 [Mucilaginibacter sp.]|nr:hypothetical protein [Mucilaginibacter sp.]